MGTHPSGMEGRGAQNAGSPARPRTGDEVKGGTFAVAV